jgi:hypothetical protein
LTPPGAQPEPAQHQQRLLPERPARRQYPELGRNVVKVEEAANAQEPLAGHLAVEDCVDDHEPVRRRQPVELLPMGPEQLARGRDELAVGQSLAGPLHARVGERRP